MIAALIAQGFDAWTSAQAAVWLHGRAAEGLGDIGLLADEVAVRAVDVLRRLRAGVSA
jgi:NAD(P)H-hydrate repair Nnr-like enzyme with NAD(P)H-hydrate dehydratase domain